MRGVVRRLVWFSAACLLFATGAVALSGCTAAPSVTLEPKVTLPASRQPGTLKVGVDLSYTPFGGTDAGEQAGIDLDVASALAAKLGLTTTFVDVRPSDAATALAGGKVDLVFSVPYNQEALSRTTLAGSYLSDGPAFFIATESTAAVVPSLTLDTLPPIKIGAQEGSAAFWRLQSEFGAESLVGYPTLRDALNGLREGKVQVAAGDALVGGYIIRDMPTVHFAGQVEPALPLGAAVALDNTKLADAVRSTLDGLSADGVLEAIRSKWVGSLPKLALPKGLESTASIEASSGP